ncbi:trans-sulfuration enzyme family protein [Aeromicrobium yanjiei]|uniref:Aminotransferase class I/II-fold pyridoxal phosphate-dependent enzyme n=1 Tax=Aeromicrobium yanjiei TaxID=2662028 RepID=A0A5Q2MCV8_9ACTN|nr:aminotransferase class I/II-fold pyridoxal phosphate-dependent enzyme [Aeromicrobium yanjiei]QGG40944.1 aminotransferase class I/II-fold pyridoxal phosphate-dependent enzyme [Aeromicrobium yanjiei]
MHGHDLSPATLAVSAGRPDRVPGGPLNAPITMASALVPGGGSEYGRAGNPTWDSFEAVLGALEGGRALAFSSGVAASGALFDLVPAKSIVVAPRHAYYGTIEQLVERNRRDQIDLRLVDIHDTQQVLAALEGAALVWIESPTNPALEVADIETIARAAAEAGAVVAVDNTFATPLRQRPLDLGADFVVHSASKLLAGHSDLILGAVVTNDDRAFTAIEKRRSVLGAIPGAMETWLATRGVRTLHVRLERAEANARELHERLSAAPQVTRSRYPGFGTMIAFEVEGGAAVAQKMTEQSEIITYATSLGGVESTWERRRRHAGEPESVPEGLIRFSVGIEDVDDLWADIQNVLAACS